MNKQYKKINFYNKYGRYICSTTWYKTCKEALENFNKPYVTASGDVYIGKDLKASYK